MSEIDCEFIDASEIEVTRGKRGGLGNGRNFIPAPVFGTSLSDRKAEYDYYKALQSSWKRRNNTSVTPYDHLIDRVFEREEEYSKLFPVTLIEIRLIVQEESER